MEQVIWLNEHDTHSYIPLMQSITTWRMKKYFINMMTRLNDIFHKCLIMFLIRFVFYNSGK